MIPDKIKTSLYEDFGYPDHPLMGQFATIVDDAPDLRTMRMFEFNERGCPIFLSHIGSLKWSQLRKNPKIAICFLNRNMTVQIVLRGRVTLIAGESDCIQLQQYWDKVRVDIKKIYDEYDVEGPFIERSNLAPPTDVPIQFGMIVVEPVHWEILKLAPMDYPNSQRIQYFYEGDQWNGQRVNVG